MSTESVPRKKLSISPCDIRNGDPKPRRGEAFELSLNPSSYSLQDSIRYSGTRTIGQIGSESRFGAIEPSTVSFDFMIDGTGIVGEPGDDDVRAQLHKLKDIVYEYEGKNHEPNVVRLLWSRFIFFGRLMSMRTEYTLFSPDGNPLRAKVALAFKSFMSAKEEERRAKKSSPDLSHRVTFRQGDTLPLLCFRIYNDSAYYQEVARYNNLANFRDIAPGTEIAFPPLS